jgi:hypothetical protein
MSSKSSRHMLNSRNISCRRSRNGSRRSDLEAVHLTACGKRGLFGCIFVWTAVRAIANCGWSRYTALTV